MVTWGTVDAMVSQKKHVAMFLECDDHGLLQGVATAMAPCFASNDVMVALYGTACGVKAGTTQLQAPIPNIHTVKVSKICLHR